MTIFAFLAFDLVLSDIIMAGPLNGIDLARKIRQHRPELPIVLMTGYAGGVGDATSEFMILRKPYRLTDLENAIGEACAGPRSEAHAG